MDTEQATGDMQNETYGSETQETGSAGSINREGSGEDRAGLLGEKTAGAGNDRAIEAGAVETEKQAGGNPSYAPNFKFKVKDKELEFDDFVKPIIKSKDVETKLKDIYEKAYGIDEVKASRDTYKGQAEEWKGKYGQVEQSLQQLGQFVQKEDFRTFFQILNIPKEKIIKYAIEELKYQELSPEQRQVIDQQRQVQTEYEQAQSQNQQLQTQMAQMIQQQATFELNQELAKPEVASVVTAYDARLGTAGAFKAEVIRRGQYYEAVHKVSPPASQLVQEVLALVGVQAQTQQGTIGSPSQEQSGPTVPTQQKKQVITGFSASGSKSPVRKVPTSVDDLRKLRQELTT